MHKMVDIVKILTRTLNKTFQDEHSLIVFHPCVTKYFSLPDSTALQSPSVSMCNLPHKKTALFYPFRQYKGWSFLFFFFFFSFRSYYHPLILPRNLNKLVKRSYSTLPFLYTLSVWKFSILFSIHVLRCWRGEFVSQSRASIVAYHFLFLVYDSGVML